MKKFDVYFSYFVHGVQYDGKVQISAMNEFDACRRVYVSISDFIYQKTKCAPCFKVDAVEECISEKDVRLGMKVFSFAMFLTMTFISFILLIGKLFFEK